VHLCLKLSYGLPLRSSPEWDQLFSTQTKWEELKYARSSAYTLAATLFKTQLLRENQSHCKIGWPSFIHYWSPCYRFVKLWCQNVRGYRCNPAKIQPLTYSYLLALSQPHSHLKESSVSKRPPEMVSTSLSTILYTGRYTDCHEYTINPYAKLLIVEKGILYYARSANHCLLLYNSWLASMPASFQASRG
jgi:hypothetical protein